MYKTNKNPADYAAKVRQQADDIYQRWRNEYNEAITKLQEKKVFSSFEVFAVIDAYMSAGEAIRQQMEAVAKSLGREVSFVDCAVQPSTNKN